MVKTGRNNPERFHWMEIELQWRNKDRKDGIIDKIIYADRAPDAEHYFDPVIFCLDFILACVKKKPTTTNRTLCINNQILGHHEMAY